MITPSKKARFTIFSEYCFRLEFNSNGIFEDGSSTVIMNRYFEDIPAFNVSINGNNIVIVTNKLRIDYLDNSEPFSATNIKINGTGFYGDVEYMYVPSGNVGKDNSKTNNLGGTFISLDNVTEFVSLNCGNNTQLNCVYAPFSKDGYAIIDDTDSIMINSTTNWISNRRNVDEQDWYFFGYGLNYQLALEQYGMLSGNIPLVSRYMLGLMHSRYYYYNTYELIEVINNHVKYEIPMDVEILDMNWHIFGYYGSYSWNTELFPYYNNTQDLIKNSGLRIGANLHDISGINTYEEYYNNAANALNVKNGQNISFDVSDINYMTVLQDIILNPITQNITKNGFDFYWNDFKDETSNNIDTNYWLNYIRGTNNLRLKYDKNRDNIMGRFGGYGSHRYPIGYSGKFNHSWEMLYYTVYFTLSASNVLYSWSNDIKGSYTNNTNNNCELNVKEHELNTRWIQFGAFSNYFRIYSDINERNNFIWEHPYKYMEIERNFMIKRSELLPYIYNASFIAYNNSISVIRPMYYDYSGFSNAYNWMYTQYKFGPNIIVSPITNTSNATNEYSLIEHWTWIPPNNYWYEEHSGYLYYYESKNNDQLSEGLWISRYFDISEMPIYIDAGDIPSTLTVQPFDKTQLIGRNNKKYYDHIRFEIYPGPSFYGELFAGQTYLYEDDGQTYAYLNNSINNTIHSINKNNVWTSIHWEYNANTKTFIANIKSIGNYNGFDPAINGRKYSLRIYNIFPGLIVRCNGIDLKYDKLYYLKTNDQLQGTYYYNGDTMSFDVNCHKTSNVFDDTKIEIIFENNWTGDIFLIQGIKGKINRAKICKKTLDNIGYINNNYPTNNLTIISTYSTLFTNIGNNIIKFTDIITSFDDIYQSSINQVKLFDINDILTSDIKQYCIDLLTTIFQ